LSGQPAIVTRSLSGFMQTFTAEELQLTGPANRQFLPRPRFPGVPGLGPMTHKEARRRKERISHR
jgi:hypothetical protein